MQKEMFLLTTAVTALGLVVTFLIHKTKAKKPKQRYVGKLSEIIMYPLKAGRGVALKEAYCSDVGLIDKDCDEKIALGDRHFIAYDVNTGLRISCKDYPIICKVEITKANNFFVLSAPGFQTFHLPSPDKYTNKVNCMIFYNIPSEAVDCGDEAADWMCKVLSASDVRLGIYVKNRIKKRKDNVGMLKGYKSVYPEMNKKYLGAYSFLASYLLINQSSLDELNTRLHADNISCTSRRFRSNLTVSGDLKPYDEDNWKYIRIGENVVLKNIKPCTRCIVTTLDPETAVFNQNNEPLKTLKTYRMLKDPEKNKAEHWSPVFGQYYGLHRGGYVKVGDPVYVLEDSND